MSVEILLDEKSDRAVLICNTTDQAFGPIFTEIDKTHDWCAYEVAENFLKWLPLDARTYDDTILRFLHHKFLNAKPVPCAYYGCEAPATTVSAEGTLNKAHADGFCSEECRDAASESADERRREAYYGSSTPQTESERYAIAAEQKRRLG